MVSKIKLAASPPKSSKVNEENGLELDSKQLKNNELSQTNQYFGIYYFLIILNFVFTFFVAYDLSVLSNDRPEIWDQLTKEFMYNDKNKSSSSANLYNFNRNLLEVENNFSPDMAYYHLLRLGTKIHSYNTIAVEQVEEYLLSYAVAVKNMHDKLYGPGKIIIDFDRRTALVAEEKIEKLSKNNFTVPIFFEASSLLIKVKGSNSKKHSALLLSAHFDSHGSSHGASDDGISVAILMETLRLVLKNPPKNDMIFFFNSGEEKGLLGSKAFLKHPWHLEVSKFINLEASGVGGRALLFQSASQVLNKAFSVSPNPHSSVIGNDAFKLKVLNSRTDFEVYQRAGIPGVDVALYSNRAFYHTRSDDIKHIYYSSLKRFGETICSVIENISSDDSQDKTLDGGVFFDVLGLFMISTSFEAMKKAMFLGFFLHSFVLYFSVRRLKTITSLTNSLFNQYLLVLRGLGSIFCGILGFFIVSFISNSLWVLGEGVHTHSFALWIYLSYTPLALASLLFSLSYWRRYERITPLAFKHVLRCSMMMFYMILQFLNILALERSIGALFIFSLMTISNTIINLLDLNTSKKESLLAKFWPFQFIICCFLTFALQGFSIVIITCLSQGIPTGSPKSLAYHLCSALGLISVLGYSTLTFPLLNQRNRYTIFSLFCIWILSSLLILFASPLSETSPLVFHFDQHVCISSVSSCRNLNPDSSTQIDTSHNSSFVRIIGPAYLPEALGLLNVPVSYLPYYRQFQQARYVGIAPTFDMPVSEVISANFSSKPILEGYNVLIKLHGYSSHICGIWFKDQVITNLAVTTTPDLNTWQSLPSGHAYLMRRNVTKPFHISLKTSLKILELSTWCGYDDADLFIPAFSEVSEKLPNWALLSTAMPTLLSLHKDFTFSLD